MITISTPPRNHPNLSNNVAFELPFVGSASGKIATDRIDDHISPLKNEVLQSFIVEAFHTSPFAAKNCLLFLCSPLPSLPPKAF